MKLFASKMLLCGLTLGLVLAGCSRGRKSVRQRTPGEAAPIVKTPTEEDKTKTDEGKAEITAPFVAKDFTSRGIAVEDLTFKFSYLEARKEGPIDFGGADTVEVDIGDNLPIGQSGTLSLEVYAGGVIKFRKSLDNVTLVAGQNNLELNLDEVGTASASLKLRIKINTPGPAPVPTPTAHDVPATWDANSFGKNAELEIVEVSVN